MSQTRPRFSGKFRGINHDWVQILDYNTILEGGDVVIAASAIPFSGDSLTALLGKIEKTRNSAAPTKETPYTHIVGWAGHPLSALISPGRIYSKHYQGGWAIRRADRVAGAASLKPQRLVDMLPKNIHFAKPLPLP